MLVPETVLALTWTPAGPGEPRGASAPGMPDSVDPADLPGHSEVVADGVVFGDLQSFLFRVADDAEPVHLTHREGAPDWREYSGPRDVRRVVQHVRSGVDAVQVTHAAALSPIEPKSSITVRRRLPRDAERVRHVARQVDEVAGGQLHELGASSVGDGAVKYEPRLGLAGVDVGRRGHAARLGHERGTERAGSPIGGDELLEQRSERPAGGPLPAWRTVTRLSAVGLVGTVVIVRLVPGKTVQLLGARSPGPHRSR